MKYDPENEKAFGKREHHLYESGDYLKEKYSFGIEVTSDRVVRKHAMASTKEMFDIIQAICLHFLRHPNRLVVPIYAFEATCIPSSKYAAHAYHYDMMRMGSLTNDEKLFFGSYRYHANKEVDGYKNHTKLASFLDEVLAEGTYRDLHDMNVMKDEDDNYRLIDLEGFYLSPLEREENDWLRA